MILAMSVTSLDQMSWYLRQTLERMFPGGKFENANNHYLYFDTSYYVNVDIVDENGNTYPFGHDGPKVAYGVKVSTWKNKVVFFAGQNNLESWRTLLMQHPVLLDDYTEALAKKVSQKLAEFDWSSSVAPSIPSRARASDMGSQYDPVWHTLNRLASVVEQLAHKKRSLSH
jgi:hypothetical protein